MTTPSSPLTPLTPVLHLLNGEVYSGLERVVDHLADAAPASGFNLLLAFLKPDTMRARMSSTRAAVHEMPMRSRFDLGVARAAAVLATDSGCRLLHSHTVRSALVARRVQRLTGLPWVHQVHSPALRESARRGMNLANYLAEATVMRHADWVVTVSRGLADYVLRHYRVSPDRITVVPNGVEAPRAAPRRSSPDGRADKLADGASCPVRQPDRGCIVLSVGLFRDRKGIEHLVDAAALLRDAGHHFRLRLAGEFADPGYEAAIRRRVRALGLLEHIEFLGFVRDVAQALDDCDVFTLPSLYGEGMPMAVLEAMAHERPVVASDIDGIRELLEGGAGLLVPPASAQHLADALGRLVTDPHLRARLACSGRERQRQRHSLEAVGLQIFDGYRRLLGAAGAFRRRKTP